MGCYKKMTGETGPNTESITFTGWTNNPFTVQKNEWEVYCIVLAVVTTQTVLGILLQNGSVSLFAEKDFYVK